MQNFAAVQKTMLLIALGLVLVVSACGGSGSSPVFNIAGTWYIFHSTAGAAGEQGPDLFTFSTSNSDLSGTTAQNESLTGSVNSLDVSFSWTAVDGTVYHYAGTVSDTGSTMSGTWTATNGQSGTWHALYNNTGVNTANIAGTWNATTTLTGTQGTQGPATVVFQQSGNTLAGTAPGGPAIIGAVSFQTVTFSWGDVSTGITFVFTGNINSTATAISGTWTATKVS